MRERRPLSGRLALVRLALLAGFGALVLFAAVSLGPMALSPAEVLGALAGRDSPASLVLREVRLPRVLAAAVLGAMLAMAGSSFQGILRNPLADPYLLGVAGGAGLGLALGVLLGWSRPVATALALGGALLAWLGVDRLATAEGRLAVWRLLLAGAVVNAISGAGIFWLQSLSSPEQLHAILSRLLGRIPALELRTGLLLALAAAIGLGWLLWRSREFNLLALGDSAAESLGVDAERLRREAYTLGSALTALAVAEAGLIGFVGLIVPHALRMTWGPDHRLLFPASALVGASFLVLSDLVARTAVAPAELPVGVVTALVGGPFFLVLLMRRSHRA